MSETDFNISGSSLILKRFPYYGEKNLRAWDAADEYLLNRFHERFSKSKPLHILVLNDQYGALTLSLCPVHKITGIFDSAQSLEGLKRNAESNGIPLDTTQIHPFQYNRIQKEWLKHNETADLVLLKIPKQIESLEYQLKMCLPLLKQGTEIWAGGMVKHISPRVRTLMETFFGNSDSSRAEKKARIISSRIDKKTEGTYRDLHQTPIKHPMEISLPLPPPFKDIMTLPGIFSRRKVDAGTHFFLENLPELKDNSKVIDFGSGSGILSLAAASLNKTVSITALDDSMTAVECTGVNALRYGYEKRIECVWGWSVDLLEGTYDTLWSNPPFHENTTVSQKASEKMIELSFRKLKQGGTLHLVINRHLGYHKLIQKIYGNCSIRKKNSKYLLLTAVKKS